MGKILAFARNSRDKELPRSSLVKDLKLVILIIDSQEKTLPLVFG